jgi:pyruvate dehydrogenase E2 component (dihydrolipoamide acetyltransferase)
VAARLPAGAARAIDLPGFGDAWFVPAPEEDPVAGYTDLVAREAERLGGPVVLAGNGAGCLLCGRAALRLGPVVRGVVMTGPVGLDGGHARLGRLSRTRAGAALVRWAGISPFGRGKFLRDQLARPAADDEAARILREALVRARGFRHLARVNRPESLAGLAELACPVRILWGDADGVLPVTHAKDFAARIGRATLEIVPGAAHALPLERPDLVAAAIAALA